MKNYLYVSLYLTLLFNLVICSAFNNLYKVNEKHHRDYQFDELKEPHYFTEYIEAGDLETARTNGKVNLLNEVFDNNEIFQTIDKEGNFESFAGYFTVNKECNSNLYTWFFKNKNASAEVLLWLQGGPGGSSLYGLFTELGPYYIDKDLKLHYREHAWTDNYSVLFVDNPVGTGFSFTDKEECYARNETDVSRDLFTFLVQFFILFPELKNNDFYLSGESYAGKYIPYLAYTIHQHKALADKYFNLKGIIIGDGWVDPENQLNYDDLLYQIGLIDENQKKIVRTKLNKTVELINKQDWLNAYDLISELLFGDDLGNESLFTNLTGTKNIYNFLIQSEPLDQFYWQQYIMQDKVRNLINVGNRSFSDGRKVEKYLRKDFMQSVKNELITILRNDYKTLLYNGQLDITCAPITAESYLSKLNWEGIPIYLNATRKVWKVSANDTEIAGYVKSVISKNKQFHYVVVRNASHLVPYDQPKNVIDLLKRFFENRL